MNEKNLCKVCSVIATACQGLAIKLALILLVNVAVPISVSAASVFTQNYPDVWWWQVKGSLRAQSLLLLIEEQYAKTPHQAPEIYVEIKSLQKNGEVQRELLEFFSMRTSRVQQVKDLGNEVLRYDLFGGRKINLREFFERDWGSRDAYASGSNYASSTQLRVDRISAFGVPVSDKKELSESMIDKWVNPSTSRSWALDQPLLSCDPIHWGLQASNPKGESAWRKVIVAYGPEVRQSFGPAGRTVFAPYFDECWTRGQREIATVQSHSPVLKDDTVLLILGLSGYGDLGVLRVRVKDGLPERLPSNVRAMDYDGLMRLKAVLSDVALERLKAPDNTGHRMRNSGFEGMRSEFLILQNYFFPKFINEFPIRRK